ncbi:MAG: DUF6090 family protein [Balneolaceae bacterium]|nr:DUF6090 family protein [Balneolaceae bacterium]
MITFFRRIREKLIASGSITKYLLYAIGEILLVVIGILIALQVNNWNEERLRQNEEKTTLENLLADLNSSKIQLESKINSVEADQEAIIKMLNMDPDTESIDNGSIDKIADEVLAPPTFDPDEANIREIINSGKISLISNEILRNSILKWEGSMQDVREIQLALASTSGKEFELISNAITLRSFYAELGPSDFESTSSELLYSKQIENYYTLKFRRLNVLMDRYQAIGDLIDTMIIEIEKAVMD